MVQTSLVWSTLLLWVAEQLLNGLQERREFPTRHLPGNIRIVVLGIMEDGQDDDSLVSLSHQTKL